MDYYDFIVVGAGSGGCVVANRLSESGRYSVLLLEAGGWDRYPWIHVPIGYGKTMFNSRVNWGYWTEGGAEIDSRSIYWPRGKVMGGSSSINGLIYIRGQAEDYEDWARAGNEGWDWTHVLPYFMKAENQVRGADAYHGVDGPLWVSDVTEPHELCDAFIRAGEEVGIPYNKDFNGPTQEGVGYFQFNTRKGRRCSAADAYIKPIVNRHNLSIEVNALCTRIAFDEGRAVGVRYKQGEHVRDARARCEVVLSAGAINSPQLLELSGVGDPAVLKEHGISTTHVLPGVGRNLQDHLQARLIYKCTRSITTNDDLKSIFRKMRMGLRYLLFRKGPLAVGINQAGGFIRSRADVDRPDLQFHFGTLSSDQPGSAVHDFSGFTLSTCQLRPVSRGSVHIRSDKSDAYPAIQPNYLADDEDQRVMVDGTKVTRRLTSAPAMKNFIAEEYSPGPRVCDFAELLQFLRSDATTIFHPVGTCRMGDDREAVVDARLRVRGLRGLRVIDASIMPTIVSGNTNAPVIMIAEKGADMILEDATA